MSQFEVGQRDNTTELSDARYIIARELGPVGEVFVGMSRGVAQALIDTDTELTRLRATLNAISKTLIPPADSTGEMRHQRVLYAMRGAARTALGIDPEADIANIADGLNKLDGKEDVSRSIVANLERLLSESSIYIEKECDEYYIESCGKDCGTHSTLEAALAAAAEGIGAGT